MQRKKKDGTPYVNPNSYNKKLNEKYLPEAWHRMYRLKVKRLKKFYKAKRGIANPLFDILLERVASISTKLEYYESQEFKDTYNLDIHDPKEGMQFNFLTTSLNKSMEQMMKYTEKKASKVTANKETNTVQIEGDVREVKSLSDGEITNRVNQIISGGKKRIRITATRTTEKEPDQEKDMD